MTDKIDVTEDDSVAHLDLMDHDLYDDNDVGALFFARHRIQSTAALQAENEALREALERCRDREYNPFEPNNQTKLYHDIDALLEKKP